MKKHTENYKKENGIDWVITLVPLIIILVLSGLLMLIPEQAQQMVERLKGFFVNDLGFFYIILGLAVLLIAIGLAFSKYGNIKFGKIDKPRYKTLSWGAMIFTSTMGADILYWSLVEWGYYYNATPFGMESMSLAQKQDWAATYPLFHWGPIPWAFYILPACAFAYMMFAKNRQRQTLSEACRPILKGQTDKWGGRIVDIFSIVGLLAGAATVFSLSTPLFAEALAHIMGVEPSVVVSIIFLLIMGVVFVVAVLKGMKAISYLANICVVVFIILLAWFFISGPKMYILESGITAIGNMVNNFFSMATWMDPLRVSGTGGSGFPQDWTIFYWAYWIAWFMATPFFIAKISEGRTMRQTILGGLSCGLLGTYTSFITFGSFGLHLQTSGKVDIAGELANGAKPSSMIIRVFEELPLTNIALIVLIIAMIALFATTFDAVTLVVAAYSEKNMKEGKEPRNSLRVFWSLVFLILPISLLFSESTLSNLQTISIVAAFPLGIIIIMIVYSFLKELRGIGKEEEGQKEIEKEVTETISQ